MRTLHFTLVGERPRSWNSLARMNVHIWQREVERVKLMVRAAIDNPEMTPFDGPVDIDLVAYFKGKTQDSDNLPIKLYTDGLKGLVIDDDDNRYVRRVTCESRLDRENPRVEITVTEVADGTI